MMKIYVPIHFTHNADIDGIGCALLSKLVFGRVRLTDNLESCYISNPYIIPCGAGFKNTDLKMDTILNDFQTFKSRLDDFISSEICNIKVVDSVNLIIIVSDIEIRKEKFDVFISNLDSFLNTFDDNHEILLWEFDHHSSNTRYPTFNIVCDKGECLPKRVEVIINYYDDTHIIPLCEMSPFESYVLDKYGLSTTYSISEEKTVIKPERSATYLYFNFLYYHRFINYFNIEMKFNETDPLARFKPKLFKGICSIVSHISNYDTYEFDKRTPAIPSTLIMHEGKKYLPDILTILWKSYNYAFFDFLNDLRDSLFNEINYDGIKTSCSNDDKRCTDLPLNDKLVSSSKILYEQRESDYKSAVKYCKAISFKDFKEINYDGIKTFCINNEERYTDLPLNDKLVSKAKILYEQRESDYKNAIKYCKVISFKDFKDITKLDGTIEQIELNDEILVFLNDLRDCSYILNRALKDNPNFKFAIAAYTSNRVISLRSNNHDLNCPNVGDIAIKLGGGGHKHASGFTLSEVQFCELLMLCWSIPDGIIF